MDALLFTFTLLTPVLAADTSNLPPRPADPYADPANDIYNPLRYIASNALTGVAFSLVLLTAIAQTLCLRRWGAKWMMSMIIAAYTFSIGLALRFGLHANPEGTGLYIAEYLFVVLSPCGFIAATYVLLGRLSAHLGSGQYLLVSPQRITKVFVASDIATFLIQAAGGGTSVSHDPKTSLTGSRIFLAGLALQLLSFVCFTIVYIVFLVRVFKQRPDMVHLNQGKPWYNDWRALAATLLVSCVGILIRSVYRTIELGQGYHGHLATTEAFFYGLDTLPLFIAIVVFVPFWPGRFITGHPADVDARSPNGTVTNADAEAEGDGPGEKGHTQLKHEV